MEIQPHHRARTPAGAEAKRLMLNNSRIPPFPPPASDLLPQNYNSQVRVGTLTRAVRWVARVLRGCAAPVSNGSLEKGSGEEVCLLNRDKDKRRQFPPRTVE